ncbi:MAG: hypothetical protein P4L33_18575 [Capsulimonadaceae bacterium]|nr:hypothetical protein [Capsulimonadaceae bacterium]
MTPRDQAGSPRHTLTTVLAIVALVGVLASILFPSVVGHVQEGDIPADVDLDNPPAVHQVVPRPKTAYHAASRLRMLASAEATMGNWPSS